MTPRQRKQSNEIGIVFARRYSKKAVRCFKCGAQFVRDRRSATVGFGQDFVAAWAAVRRAAASDAN
jgi:hypothetical protein